eukprot:Skav233459  [mRNA]  locus=scaffold1080:144953:146175:- [translate_table: standard]
MTADTPAETRSHVRCKLLAMSGNVLTEINLPKGEPWKEAVPHDRLCAGLKVPNFELVVNETVVYPSWLLVPGQDVEATVVVSAKVAFPRVRFFVGRNLPVQDALCHSIPLFEVQALQTSLTAAVPDMLKQIKVAVSSVTSPDEKDGLRDGASGTTGEGTR